MYFQSHKKIWPHPFCYILHTVTVTLTKSAIYNLELPSGSSFRSVIKCKHTTHIISCLSFFISKSKAKGWEEDENQKNKDEHKPQQEAVVEKPWTMPYDAQLNNLIKESFKSVLPLNDEVEMYTTLAM